MQCGPLFQMVQKNGRLANDTARFFAAQVVMAVQYLHGEHVVYRDLNPENVLLDRGLYVRRGHSKRVHRRCTPQPTAPPWLCARLLCRGCPRLIAGAHSRGTGQAL